MGKKSKKMDAQHQIFVEDAVKMALMKNKRVKFYWLMPATDLTNSHAASLCVLFLSNPYLKSIYARIFMCLQILSINSEKINVFLPLPKYNIQMHYRCK